MGKIHSQRVIAALLFMNGTCISVDGQTLPAAEPLPVKLENLAQAKRVDVTIGGALFTSYQYAAAFEKPFLFPIVAADGITVTRGFPILPRPGEGVDHPHHTGFWFNYGNVNGIDFWGNSKALPAEQRAKCGIIRLRNIEKLDNYPDQGRLVLNQEWIGPNESLILSEKVTFIFRGGKNFRIIDHITTLTAQSPEVVFNDTKEGAFAIRVARFLEGPSNEPKIYVDAQGQVTNIPMMNNEGVNGKYLSSEGIEGVAVWSTRAKWMKLSGVSGSSTESIVFMDHPANPNYPTFWHARDYGLFSANPFGQKEFTVGKEVFNLKLTKGKSVTFKHRLLIQSGTALPTSEIGKSWENFVSELTD